LRAAQDNQTALQAALDQAQKQRDLLQQQVTQLKAQLAAQAATPAAPAAPPPQQAADEQQLHDAIDALKKQNAALQDGLTHWQSAYQQAATLAQAKDVQGRQSAQAASTAQRTLDVCEGKNARLTGVAEDILHLYETPRFRSLARGDWDGLLGFKRVELENIVQDNEDRILDQKYRPGEQPAPTAPPPAAGAAAPAPNGPTQVAQPGAGR
jgi:DNA repair exonuclease SbcCD ATPase subunit